MEMIKTKCCKKAVNYHVQDNCIHDFLTCRDCGREVNFKGNIIKKGEKNE